MVQGLLKGASARLTRRLPLISVSDWVYVLNVILHMKLSP